MKLLTTLAALTMSAAALTAAEPEPRFFNPAQEARVKSLEDRVAALEAQPARPQPAPAATLPAAPAFEAVSYDYGRTWVTRQVPGTFAATTPVFSTPVRDAIYQFTVPSGCAGGQCPTPRRR